MSSEPFRFKGGLAQWTGLRLKNESSEQVGPQGSSPGAPSRPPDGLLDVGIARFALSELATSQMCQRLGIPVLYYRRLPHELQAMIANHDFGRLHENAYLLRGKDEWVRAVLSTDYVAYNKAHIAETVKELLREAQVAVKSF